MSSQAFLDGYLSKEAGVGDWLKGKLRNLGAVRSQPAQNFGSAEGADYMRAGNLTARYKDTMREINQQLERMQGGPTNEATTQWLGKNEAKAETARQALKKMPAGVVRPELR
jgi:hypothetical protein